MQELEEFNTLWQAIETRAAQMNKEGQAAQQVVEGMNQKYHETPAMTAQQKAEFIESRKTAQAKADLYPQKRELCLSAALKEKLQSLPPAERVKLMNTVLNEKIRAWEQSNLYDLLPFDFMLVCAAFVHTSGERHDEYPEQVSSGLIQSYPLIETAADKAFWEWSLMLATEHMEDPRQGTKMPLEFYDKLIGGVPEGTYQTYAKVGFIRAYAAMGTLAYKDPYNEKAQRILQTSNDDLFKNSFSAWVYKVISQEHTVPSEEGEGKLQAIEKLLLRSPLDKTYAPQLQIISITLAQADVQRASERLGRLSGSEGISARLLAGNAARLLKNLPEILQHKLQQTPFH